MTETQPSGHEPPRSLERDVSDAQPNPTFDEVYDAHVAFLYRAARAFGVSAAAVDDVMQDVFVVVHRRLGEHDGRALRAWLLRILFNVVREHRRAYQRKGERSARSEDDVDALADSSLSAEEQTSLREAREILLGILDGMEAHQREVFVLVELEQVPVPEIAEAMGASLNTTYSRLRLARRHFSEAVARTRRAEVP